MNRLEAISRIVEWTEKEDLMIHANGAISRESFHCADRPGNFYMLGSMGLASSIALGVALQVPLRRVVVLDGDGNLLMGFGNLALIGALKPADFFHILLDNRVYGTTGNQPTGSDRVDWVQVARGCGYRQALRITTGEELNSALQRLGPGSGPHLLQVDISTDVPFSPLRIPYTARQMKERFMRALLG